MMLAATPFLVAGGAVLLTGVRELLEGTLKSWFTIAFGVVFLGAGALVLKEGFDAMRSAESVAAERARRGARAPAGGAQREGGESDVLPTRALAGARDTGYREPARRTRSAREVYGAALASLPVPQLADRPGQVLAHAISSESPGSTFGEIFAALVVNGFTWPFFYAMLASGSVLRSLFTALFVAAGTLFLVGTVKKVLGRQRLPRVEISAEPTYLGDELQVHVDQMGPARITRYVVLVCCEEVVKFTVGTDTRTERARVWAKVLFDEPGRNVRLGEHWTHDLAVVLPEDAPCSFESPHNEVRWEIRIRAEIAGWPDYDEGFVFRALPRPAS